MNWIAAALLGAAGGALVQAIALYACVGNWQQARRLVRNQDGAVLPPFSKYIDVPADTAVAVTRLVLGAAAGSIFHGQILGIAAAVAVGASAPAVLQQLGAIRSIRDAVQPQGDKADAAPRWRSSHRAGRRVEAAVRRSVLDFPDCQPDGAVHR